MLKTHVKLFSKAVKQTLRDMEVGAIYRGNKGVPKIVIQKTPSSIVVRNFGENRTYNFGLKRNRQKVGTRLLDVVGQAINNPKDIAKLVSKARSV